MTNYSANQGQTVYDICLQVYGTLDKLYQLIQDSNFDNVLKYPSSGNVFIFDPTKVKDYIFAQWLNNTKVVLNTGQPGQEHFILQENGSFILQEDGSRLILEP